MDDTRQRYSAVTCSCVSTGARIGSDDHCNTLVTLAFSIFNMVDWKAKRRKRQAAMAVNSSRNGSTERSTRKGRAGVLPSGSCLPPGTVGLLLLFLTRALLIRVRMHFGRGHVWCHDAFRRQVRAGGIIRVHHLADAAGRCRSALNPLSLTNSGFTPHVREEKDEHGSKNNKRKQGGGEKLQLKSGRTKCTCIAADDDNRNFVVEDL